MAQPSRADEKRKFQDGFERFNRGQFFEAHESWEEIWLHAPKHEKPFLQGIIQVAAAFHHYQRSNSEGCEPLRASVRWWLAELRAGRAPAAKHIPRLERAKPARTR